MIRHHTVILVSLSHAGQHFKHVRIQHYKEYIQLKYIVYSIGICGVGVAALFLAGWWPELAAAGMVFGLVAGFDISPPRKHMLQRATQMESQIPNCKRTLFAVWLFSVCVWRHQAAVETTGITPFQPSLRVNSILLPLCARTAS